MPRPFMKKRSDAQQRIAMPHVSQSLKKAGMIESSQPLPERPFQIVSFQPHRDMIE